MNKEIINYERRLYKKKIDMKTYDDVRVGDTVYIFSIISKSVEETTVIGKYDIGDKWQLAFSNGCVGHALKNTPKSTMDSYHRFAFSDEKAIEEYKMAILKNSPKSDMEQQFIEEERRVIAYKGFDKNLCCRGFQYEVGKEYEHAGEVVCCKNGFHACTNPFDVLEYYWPHGGNRFCEVEQSGVIKSVSEDTKQASSKIKIVKEIGLGELLKAAVVWLEKELDPDKERAKIKGPHVDTSSYFRTDSAEDDVYIGLGWWHSNRQIFSTGDRVRIGSNGSHNNINSRGLLTQISSSGDNVRINSVGDYTQVSSSGPNATINFWGNHIKVGSTGYNSYVNSFGYCATIFLDGYSPKISATGNRSAVYSTGECAKINTSGNDVIISASGDNSQILSSGINHQIESTGSGSTICCAARDSVVKAGVGSWITLYEWSSETCGNTPVHIKTKYVDGKRIKGDTWYKLIDGKFVEQ